MKYYHDLKLNCSFDEAVEKTNLSLKEEGFGVLTEIDIQQKFKEKLNVEFRKYKILGACNPPYALKALLFEDKIGTMLPCNVIVQELDNNDVEVAVINPMASMMAIEDEGLKDIAQEINQKLENVIKLLKQ